MNKKRIFLLALSLLVCGASIENTDRVIVMDKGKVVDFDTPSNLLKSNKIYKEVYESQKKGVML